MVQDSSHIPKEDNQYFSLSQRFCGGVGDGVLSLGWSPFYMEGESKFTVCLKNNSAHDEKYFCTPFSEKDIVKHGYWLEIVRSIYN